MIRLLHINKILAKNVKFELNGVATAATAALILLASALNILRLLAVSIADLVFVYSVHLNNKKINRTVTNLKTS
jgi:hypothetical protein